MKPEVVEPPTSERAKQTAAVNEQALACECSEADRRMLEGPRSRTSEFVHIMRQAIALNAAHFNTQAWCRSIS